MSIDNTTQSVNVKAFDMTKEATLVKLSITKYGGNKKDKGLAEESAEKHEMNADVVSTTLTVLDKTVTKIVGKIASAARTWLNHNAAVYDDTGWRMIRNSQFEKIRTQLEAYKLEFMEAVNENIISKYDALRWSLIQMTFDAPTCLSQPLMRSRVAIMRWRSTTRRKYWTS